MKQFDTFSEYMFDLLFAPLKKGRKTANQLRIFFKVMGREFDDLKAAIFRVRNEANVASCSEVMLPVHGQDRDMPRLEGEDAEAYRTRLSMKGIISQWSGTRRGVLYALTALGYDRSRIELFAEQDAERWAEFIIFLNSSKPSGVTNLSVIDAQVRKVKEGSSKPAYGMETIGGLIIRSQLLALSKVRRDRVRRVAAYRQRRSPCGLDGHGAGRRIGRRQSLPESRHICSLRGVLSLRSVHHLSGLRLGH